MDGILIPIKKEFSDKILDGIKPVEFRTQWMAAYTGKKIFLYETKTGRVKGSGKIVGYFTSGGIYFLMYSGTYAMLPLYAHYMMDEKEEWKLRQSLCGIPSSNEWEIYKNENKELIMKEREED